MCEALGYKQTYKAVERHVDEDDGMKRPIIDSIGRNQLTTFINDSCLYALILGYKLGAKARHSKHYPLKQPPLLHLAAVVDAGEFPEAADRSWLWKMEK